MNPMTGDGLPLDFAQTKEEAEARYDRFVSKDPFPDIAPALLNSADIYDYVRATGMVCPFEPDPNRGKLKSASYEADFLGDLHLVKANETYEIQTIKVGDIYELPRNSIAFLFLETTFRLPDYIAARFNLRISLIHAGLLLGTGPLIDPGFAGRLLIPLHNLTSDPYPIKGGEGVIWIEFTKLSINKRWSGNSGYERIGEYRPFPLDKRGRDAATYFSKASRSGTPIPASSSIPLGIRTIEQSAQEARNNAEQASKSSREASEEAKRLSSRATIGGLVALAALLSSLAGLYVSVFSLVRDTASELRENSDAIRESLVNVENRIRSLEERKRQRLNGDSESKSPVPTNDKHPGTTASEKVTTPR